MAGTDVLYAEPNCLSAPDGLLRKTSCCTPAPMNIHACSSLALGRMLMNLKIIFSIIALAILVSACASSTTSQRTSNDDNTTTTIIDDRQAGPLYPAGDGALVDLEGRPISPGGAK